MFRIDVTSSRELQAVLLAIRGASTEISRQYRQRVKAVADDAWLEAIRGRVSTRMQSRVLLGSARTAVSNQNVRLSAGTVGRPLSKRTGGAGAARPVDLLRAVEFGGSQTKYSDYQRRARGATGKHDVRRRTLTGYGAFNRKGNAVYPALKETVPRIAALIVQTCVRTLRDAFEGKR